MGIYEMLAKNSPHKSSMEKEKQSQYERLVDTNKELVDKIKELEKKVEYYKRKYHLMKKNAETLAELLEGDDIK